MSKNRNSIIQKATWKKAALFSVLFAAFYVLINFSGIGVAGLLKITGGANILDFEFGFAQEKAYRMLTALGADGRAFYLNKILPMDFLFPFTYMLFYAGWMALLIKDTALREWCKHLLFVPVLAMLFDWVENVGIIVMLNGYPILPAWAVSMASIAGIFKTVFTIVSIAVIGVLFIMFIVKKIRK